MKYFTQIQAFFNRKMTGVEREAFEHELKDNVDLANELEAYQTGIDLLGFTSGNMSEEQILSYTKQNNLSKKGWKEYNFFYLGGMVFLIALIGLLLLTLGDEGKGNLNQQKKPSIQPVKEIELPTRETPIAKLSSEQLQPTSKESVNIPAVIETNESRNMVVSPIQTIEIEKPSPKLQVRKSNILAKLENKTHKATKINSSFTELTSDALIASGEKIVYQAGQQIKLTPGFHAKAGSSFKAMVKKD